MYSDRELSEAVDEGVLTAVQVDAFRAFVERRNAAPLADEEQFRLLTSFNDVFVSIAIIATLIGVGWLGNFVGVGLLAVAAASWALAEYFTRRRRMALPSIVLLVAFVGGTMSGLSEVFGIWFGRLTELLFVPALALTAGATYLHWRRFAVPITVSAGAATCVALAFALIALIPGIPTGIFMPLLSVSGVAVFALAMRWDSSDRLRRTRRSDVAFWLHLLAAPMIIHPVFSLFGAFEAEITIVESFLILGIYILLAVCAVAIDRRAVLVSALAYVLYAIGTMFSKLGGFVDVVPLTAGTIGSALLLLSVLWQRARAVVLRPLPERLRDLLPPV